MPILLILSHFNAATPKGSKCLPFYKNSIQTNAKLVKLIAFCYSQIKEFHKLLLLGLQAPIFFKRLVQNPLYLTIHTAKFVGRPLLDSLQGVRVQP